MHWMFLPLKRYVDFTGRSRRMEFWMWKLLQVVVGTVFTILWWILFISVAMSGAGTYGRYGDRGDPGAAFAAIGALGGIGLILIIVWGVWSLFCFLPDLAVTIRRLHDTNRSGWWVLAPSLPYLIGVFALFAGGFGAAASGMGRNGQLSNAGGAALGGGFIVFFLCMLVALGLGIMLLVLMFLDSTNGPNRFGPDPKAGQRGYDQTFA